MESYIVSWVSEQEKNEDIVVILLKTRIGLNQIIPYVELKTDG